MESEIHVRDATEDDLGMLLAAAEEFVARSTWPWTFDRDAANRSFWEHLNNPDSRIIIAQAPDGRYLSGVILLVGRDFSRELQGYVVKLCVAPAGRRTPATRLVVAAALQWFRERGCQAVFANCIVRDGKTAKTFANLFGRHGFAEAGPLLALEMT